MNLTVPEPTIVKVETVPQSRSPPAGVTVESVDSKDCVGAHGMPLKVTVKVSPTAPVTVTVLGLPGSEVQVRHDPSAVTSAPGLAVAAEALGAANNIEPPTTIAVTKAAADLRILIRRTPQP